MSQLTLTIPSARRETLQVENHNDRGIALDNEPILPKIAAGDSGAVAECLDRYGGLVWSLARRSCSDQQLAEDAVQDIFLKLWKVADRFKPEIASETTFISMIARRQLIDMSRKKSLPSSGGIELDHFESSVKDASSRIEVVDEAAKAADLLETLPEDQRRVIKLSIYEGLSHSKIADATGLSLGTVKTHLRRGMLKLRQSLFPQHEINFASSIGEASS